MVDSLVNLKVNDKIKKIRETDKEKYSTVLDYINQIATDNMILSIEKKMSIDSIELHDRVYKGYCVNFCKLFDKVTIDRRDFIYDLKDGKVKRIKNEIIGKEELLNNSFIELFNFKEGYKLDYLWQFLKFVCYSLNIGNPDISDVTDEMKDKWYSYNLPELYVTPGNYFTRLHNFNYYNLGFETFVNLTRYEAYTILIENLFNENKIVQVSVIIEMYIYMPYVYVSLIEYIRKNKINIFDDERK